MMYHGRIEKTKYRVIITGYEQGKSLPYVKTPTHWQHDTCDAAEDKIDEYIADQLNRLNGTATNPPFHRKHDEIHVTDLGLRDRLVARYEIHPVEQGFCFDENGNKKSYWEYRDYRIYTNQKGNRFKIIRQGQFVAIRYTLNKCLDTIDQHLLIATLNLGGI